MADESTTPEEPTTLRDKIREANRLLAKPPSRAQISAPRRNFTFEPKIPGVPRTQREPNPGFNSDPEYTAASQAHYDFQQGELEDYGIALAQYQDALKLHASNIKQGIDSEPPIPPKMPTAPPESKVIRTPSEARRWYKSLSRAQSISISRAGLDRQASGATGSKFDTESVTTQQLSSEELRKRQEEALERRFGQTPLN